MGNESSNRGSRVTEALKHIGPFSSSSSCTPASRGDQVKTPSAPEFSTMQDQVSTTKQNDSDSRQRSMTEAASSGTRNRGSLSAEPEPDSQSPPFHRTTFSSFRQRSSTWSSEKSKSEGQSTTMLRLRNLRAKGREIRDKKRESLDLRNRFRKFSSRYHPNDEPAEQTSPVLVQEEEVDEGSLYSMDSILIPLSTNSCSFDSPCFPPTDESLPTSGSFWTSPESQCASGLTSPIQATPMEVTAVSCESSHSSMGEFRDGSPIASFGSNSSNPRKIVYLQREPEKTSCSGNSSAENVFVSEDWSKEVQDTVDQAYDTVQAVRCQKSDPPLGNPGQSCSNYDNKSTNHCEIYELKDGADSASNLQSNQFLTSHRAGRNSDPAVQYGATSMAKKCASDVIKPTVNMSSHPLKMKLTGPHPSHSLDDQDLSDRTLTRNSLDGPMSPLVSRNGSRSRLNRQVSYDSPTVIVPKKLQDSPSKEKPVCEDSSSTEAIKSSQGDSQSGGRSRSATAAGDSSRARTLAKNAAALLGASRGQSQADEAGRRSFRSRLSSVTKVQFRPREKEPPSTLKVELDDDLHDLNPRKRSSTWSNPTGAIKRPNIDKEKLRLEREAKALCRKLVEDLQASKPPPPPVLSPRPPSTFLPWKPEGNYLCLENQLPVSENDDTESADGNVYESAEQLEIITALVPVSVSSASDHSSVCSSTHEILIGRNVSIPEDDEGYLDLLSLISSSSLELRGQADACTLPDEERAQLSSCSADQLCNGQAKQEYGQVPGLALRCTKREDVIVSAKSASNVTFLTS